MRFIEESLKSPNGIILNTGPTGSGKTTTLYSCLDRLNKIDVNIMTIEDPVEISVDGLNQSQVHPDINYTFAFGMRTGLRQDPDIIMVGEIRDRETVDTAIEASLTGHLVFSTVHTNSAVETLTRIDNMGVQPFLMASTIECVIAQRLVRKICEHCKVEDQPDPHLLEHIHNVVERIHPDEPLDQELMQNMKFYKGKGCEECDGVGYTGRLGLFEVMKMNNQLRKAILTRQNALDIEQIAMQTGMITLEQAGIIKALQGETSLDEVYRVARKMEDETEITKKTPEAAKKPEPQPKPQQQPKPQPKPNIKQVPPETQKQAEQTASPRNQEPPGDININTPQQNEEG
jgi:type II secretory ATPase GspE/PulE/Tfp pilus assembly ATPase PilB-like protein